MLLLAMDIHVHSKLAIARFTTQHIVGRTLNMEHLCRWLPFIHFFNIHVSNRLSSKMNKILTQMSVKHFKCQCQCTNIRKADPMSVKRWLSLFKRQCQDLYVGNSDK